MLGEGGEGLAGAVESKQIITTFQFDTVLMANVKSV